MEKNEDSHNEFRQWVCDRNEETEYDEERDRDEKRFICRVDEKRKNIGSFVKQVAIAKGFSAWIAVYWHDERCKSVP